MANWYQKLIGSISGNVVEVDSNNQLLVRPSTNPTNSGYTGIAGIVQPGNYGVIRAKPVYATSNNRLLVGQTTYLWDDTFNATIANTSKYKFGAASQTAAQAGGFLTLNNTGITTANSNSGIQTWRSFPLFGNSELRFILSGNFPSAFGPVANNTLEFGLMSAVIPGVAIPTDGAFFRFNAAAELRGVVNFAGTESQTISLGIPSLNVSHDYMIVVNTDVVEFWVDREFRGAIQLLTDAPAYGQPFMAASQPIMIRTYINASIPVSAVKFQVSDVFVTTVGPEMSKPWGNVKAGMGHSGYQTQNGVTPGSLSNLENAVVPTASALSNTVLGTGNPAGLGGVAHVLPTLAVGTDGLLFSYLNPVGTINITPRNLVITGVRVIGVVDVILAGGPVIYLYSVAFGQTALSLATAESGSYVTGTTKKPRRIWIGAESYPATASVGTIGQGIQYQFTEPVYVSPGEYVAITARNIGTATTTGSLHFTACFDSHWE